MSRPVVLARQPPRRRKARASRWWGKAWVRGVEEAAYAAGDLAAAATLSRSGRIGTITLGAGGFVAAAEDEQSLWTVEGSVQVLDALALSALVETIGARAGRIAALLDGDLPFDLVEHAEEAGVELLPYGGELSTSCTCEAWVEPCVHGLAVLLQLTWSMEDDPLVLLHLRGLSRDELLARLHTLPFPPNGPDESGSRSSGPSEREADPDEEAALEAAVRAERLLAELDESTGPGARPPVENPHR